MSEPRISELDWQRGRWWRVTDPDGGVWCEASDEEEVRSSMRPGDRLWCSWRVELSEWREENVS